MDMRHWMVDLGKCPRLVRAGAHVHGRARSIERYSLLGFWSVHLYRYYGILAVNGHWHEIRPGCASVLPPDADLEYRFDGPSPHISAHFHVGEEVGSGQSETSSRERTSNTHARDKSPGESGRSTSSDHDISAQSAIWRALPVMQGLGDRFGQLHQRFEAVVGWSAMQPRRAEVRLWDVLWELSSAPSELLETAKGGEGDFHPAVAEAVRRIELTLSEPIAVPELARQVGVSHNHLTRLFRRSLGVTVVGYIRSRRVQLAEHLLRGTTKPIKAIAIEIGVPDLHQFNKLIRRESGTGPRQLRDDR